MGVIYKKGLFYGGGDNSRTISYEDFLKLTEEEKAMDVTYYIPDYPGNEVGETVEVVDNLDSTDPEAALSANMGRQLKEDIENINTMEDVDISENLLTIVNTGNSISEVIGRKRGKHISISFKSIFDAVTKTSYVAQITNPDFCPNYQTAVTVICADESMVYNTASGFILADGKIYVKSNENFKRVLVNIQFDQL